MTELIQVGLSDIDPNPYRMLDKYPFNEHKLETLTRSIKDVGMWEGIIGRQVGNRFQLAFGHHRVEAARRSGLTNVSLIIRNLSDEQMVQFMGRENLEDYNAEFLVMLETWEAAAKFISRAGQNHDAIDIARLLGWVAYRPDGNSVSNHTANACHGAFKLVTGEHMQQSDFEGLSVHAAEELVNRVLSRIELLDKLGARGNRPAADIAADKRVVAGAARSVARDYREGTIAKSNLRSEIDYRAFTSAKKKDRISPLFAEFAKDLSDTIHDTFVNDRVAEKLTRIAEALPIVTMEEDRDALKRIDFALATHGNVNDRWRERLTPKGEKVVPFKMLKGGAE